MGLCLARQGKGGGGIGIGGAGGTRQQAKRQHLLAAGIVVDAQGRDAAFGWGLEQERGVLPQHRILVGNGGVGDDRRADQGDGLDGGSSSSGGGEAGRNIAAELQR